MRKIFLIFISFVLVLSASAQKNKKARRDQNRKRIDALIKQEEEGVIAYKKHSAFGGKFINNGYGIFGEIGRSSSVKKGTLYQLEIAEYKSTKEEKVGSGYSYSNPFVFGKQNFFYPVKLGVQNQVLLGNKSNKNGISITGNFGGGISIGLLRPYYVQLKTTGEFIKYESADSAVFLDDQQITAGPGLGKGWNELSVTPGAYAKAALRFDYGTYNEILSALEVGIAADYYSKKVPIMVHNPAKQFFFTGYVAIMFGRRK